MRRARPVSIFSHGWTIRGAMFAGATMLCLLASPVPAQDAGVSGIPPGPANARGLNGSISDPSGIGNAAKMPALPQPVIRPVVPPAAAPSAGYRSFSPAAGYRPIHVRQAAKEKRTRFANTRSSRSARKAHVSDEDRQVDRKIISICKGC